MMPFFDLPFCTISGRGTSVRACSNSSLLLVEPLHVVDVIIGTLGVLRLPRCGRSRRVK